MELSDSKQVIVERHNKAVYRDGNRIVKVFKAEKPASDIFNEALNIARVIEAGVRVPKILEVSQVADGSWALATEYVEGVTMRSLMDAAEGTPEYDKLLEQFVDFQIEIQGVHGSDLMKDQKTKIAGMVGKAPELDPSVRYDLQMRADRMAPGRSICHCDFNPSNVIVAEDGTLYACDWTHVTRGLPEADAAMTYILFKMYHPGHAEAYLDLFSKKADIAKQKVHYWVPVMAAAELSRGRKDAEGARHGRRRALPRPQGRRGVPPQPGRRCGRHRLAFAA